jgi:hypothetical protein
MRDASGCSIIDKTYFSKHSKKELELQQKLIKEFKKNGGKVKYYGNSQDKYKLKGIKNVS